MMVRALTRLLTFSLALGFLLIPSTRSSAQVDRRIFVAQGGEAIYRSVCQGCHMPDGRGATGAGAYPSLAANPNLEAAGYPLFMVMQGRKAMPAFGDMLNDQQLSDVVNYVRSHFGNSYTDTIGASDAKELRDVR